MANKLIKEMGLPKSMANIFAARNITTAKEALSVTEFELMELLGVGLAEVRTAIAHISQITCPPHQTVSTSLSARLLLEQRFQGEHMAGHLPTRLKGLDAALCGGVPFGVLTELVGPSGIGKTQFCLKLSLLASLPASYGGLGGRVIYIDVESKFSSRRMIEIGVTSFPELFHMKGMAQEMAGRILVLRPTSLSEFTERCDKIGNQMVFFCFKHNENQDWTSREVTGVQTEDFVRKRLQQIKVSILQNQVKLLVVDSMAALLSGSLAEFSRIPVVVTNQVRSQSRDEACQYSFQWHRGETVEDLRRYDSHLIAALGIHWAHAVTIRLILEVKTGQRFLKVAKSPMSPPLAFPFNITSSGISLLTDDGIEQRGSEINTIRFQGHNDIINFDGKGCIN
ncbi:Rad51 domain-containing protein [Cephalotus follicularis]|uniref:Rad51 domain-containing protein n=1 Tax=Cephalotus follicularis TaxID=3775 RepID=A0A1Q3BTS1_CEPFO|nr:Rad51 domain-containing protein [Cephalotus follicularis]